MAVTRSSRVFKVIAAGLVLVAGPAAVRAQIKSFTGWKGATLSIDFGGLREVGGRVRPCQGHYEVDDARGVVSQDVAQAAAQLSEQQAAEAVRGQALAEEGMRAFGEARWAEAIDRLRQAQALRPDDIALGKSLASAQIALRYEELAQQRDAEGARQAAEDSQRLGLGIGRLSEALRSLRLEASQTLIDQGQFQSAITLSGRTDFVYDSSVVDLRQARQGVVDFERLKPPISRTGQVDFAPPPKRTEPPARQKARRLLDHPDVAAVIFYENMGDALGYRPSEAERLDRYADPVTRAVADSLNIFLDRATPEERAYVEQKTREVWQVYDRNKATQQREESAVAKRSVEAFDIILRKLEAKGLLKPGENVLEKEKKDPVFRALMASEVKAVVLEDDAGRREVSRTAFDRLLTDVGGTLKRRTE
jgi:hypothetical protein